MGGRGTATLRRGRRRKRDERENLYTHCSYTPSHPIKKGFRFSQLNLHLRKRVECNKDVRKRRRTMMEREQERGSRLEKCSAARRKSSVEKIVDSVGFSEITQQRERISGCNLGFLYNV